MLDRETKREGDKEREREKERERDREIESVLEGEKETIRKIISGNQKEDFCFLNFSIQLTRTY